MALYVYPMNANVRQLLESYMSKRRPTDSGFDIPCESMELHAETLPSLGQTVHLGIKVAAVSGESLRPCLLLPRSSISQTDMRLSNSIGLIDQGYRGEVMAKVDLFGPMKVQEGSRYFQLCRHDFLPWERIVIVDSEGELPSATDDRGSGGFGSTGA